MPVIQTVDYPNKKIYLHSDTATCDELDTLDVYREVRALRRTNEAHRKFDPMVVAGGNIEKIAGVSYTPAYVQLLYGCRIIPYDTDHCIKLVRDTFTDDGYSGIDCFDRTGLTSKVDIDVDIQEVEIRIISTGGSALTQEEHDQLMGLPDEGTIANAVLDETA